jgi:rubredoxin
MDDPRIPAIQLNLVTEAIRDAEDAHRQHVPLREDFNHVPTDCSCGHEYARDVGWEESRRHLREEMARAVLNALQRPCESCLGSGVWERMRTDYECPECGGQGRTIMPLPTMVFQSTDGETWVVDGFEANDPALGWARVHKDR